MNREQIAVVEKNCSHSNRPRSTEVISGLFNGGRSIFQMALTTFIKALIPGKSVSPRVVLFGLFRGIRLNLDLRSQAQVYLGLWERETYAFVRKTAQKAQWSVDVGSARGEFTLYFLKCPRMKKILAVEPWDFVSDMMQENLALNGATGDPRLTLVKKYIRTSTEAGHITLDTLALDLHQLGFIKIDVDGGELEVLRSGHELLTQGHVSLLVETHSLELEDSCMKLLSEWGYQCKLIKNAWWRSFVPEVRLVEHNRWFSAVRE